MTVSPDPSSPQAGSLSSKTEENPELLRFRQEWLAELQQRKEALKAMANKSNIKVPRADSQAGPSQHPPESNHAQGPYEPSLPSIVASGSSMLPPAYLATHPALKNGQIQQPSRGSTSSDLETRLEKALNCYRRAIEYEQMGELDEALLLYRQAFRLEDNVDRAYRREEMLKSILKDQKFSEASNSPSDMDKLAISLKEATVISSETGAAMTGTVALARFVETFLQGIVRFEAENELEPVFLNLLPEELLVHIFCHLGPTSIERFARVCKKGRLITLDSGIWRQLVRKTYQPPQIADYDTMIQVIERCNWDFRRVYIEQPRLRLDGVYIATCHYVRPGLSENSWVNTSHLITYHRYLRFYPNGQVLSLLANEEYSPQQIIPLLKPTLRMNGLLIGQWRLTGTQVYLTNLIESGKPVGILPPETYSSSLHGPSNNRPETSRYTFLMTLNLRSRPLGRWNKMEIEGYESLNLVTGDINPIILKHERPFWFSKVRSYSHS